MRALDRIARAASRPFVATLLLAAAVLAGGALIATAGSPSVSNDPGAGLSAAAESNRAAAAQIQLAGGRRSAAVVLYSAGAPLSADDLREIEQQRQSLEHIATGPVTTAHVSSDRQAALLTIPLNAAASTDETVAQVREIRQITSSGLPGGVTAEVTGPAAVTADLAGVFSHANITLLATTVGVVALLLIFTYRSPFLWLIPLLVVGLADQVTGGLIAELSRHTDLSVSNATTGIVDVLVFGAGTDYALLLIARYREQLCLREDRHQAMYHALRGAGPAILGSGLTVALSLVSLLAATLPSTTAIGVCAAVGVVTALVFALLVLPAALVLCGRWIFWPAVPSTAAPATGGDGVWGRAARLVRRRPAAVLGSGLAVLAVLALGLTGARLGLSQSQQFRDPAPSIQAQQTLAAHFPQGETDPVVLVARTGSAGAVLAAAHTVPGVAHTRIVAEGAGLAQIDAALTAAPDTPASYQAVTALRTAVHAVPGAGALVGGDIAVSLDTKNAASHDQKTLIPLVLAIVLLVLIGLLRSLIAPLLLVATVIASFLAALGAATYAFGHWLGFPALDVTVPLLAFLFLVALGVDYNIFLITRAREQAAIEGTRAGIASALTVTGPVITSAGILLAAVFAVLGVLPLITLTELGIIVGFGVLLDTLLVRTLLVPALVILLGDRFWWPADPAARARRPEAA